MFPAQANSMPPNSVHRKNGRVADTYGKALTDNASTITTGAPVSSLQQTPELCPAIDPRTFRDAMGLYASGVTVIAARDGDEPLGFTCQSFHSVSVEPPLISFNVMVTSSTYPRLRATGRFSVNVLSKTQQGISRQFARKGTDKWSGVDWQMASGRNPEINGALLWLDCDLISEYLTGDHFIVVGSVKAINARRVSDAEPLIYFQGMYRDLHT